MVFLTKPSNCCCKPLWLNLVELFNSVLMGLTPPPSEWLSNHVTFLPKTADPKSPSDLRPIVLSSTVGKVFTKCLMLRMRPRLPPIRAFQVGGIPSRQTLDSACAVQHAMRLAQQWQNPVCSQTRRLCCVRLPFPRSPCCLSLPANRLSRS